MINHWITNRASHRAAAVVATSVIFIGAMYSFAVGQGNANASASSPGADGGRIAFPVRSSGDCLERASWALRFRPYGGATAAGEVVIRGTVPRSTWGIEYTARYVTSSGSQVSLHETRQERASKSGRLSVGVYLPGVGRSWVDFAAAGPGQDACSGALSFRYQAASR